MQRRLLPYATLVALTAADCQVPPSSRDIDTALVDLTLLSVDPALILPGTVMVIEGDAFVDNPWGSSTLRLQGVMRDQAGNADPIDVRLRARFIDFGRLEVPIDAGARLELGPSGRMFDGLAIVEVQSVVDGRLYRSRAIEAEFEVRDALDPAMELAQPEGLTFPNEPIELRGDGLLLPGEGESAAIVVGCIRPPDGGTCKPLPAQKVAIASAGPFDRTRGTFPFSPRIAGIVPGHFVGEVIVENTHISGETRRSSPLPCSFDLEAPVLYGVSTDRASLGQYVTVAGAGFVAAPEGATELHFVGGFAPDDGTEALELDEILLPEVVDGRTLRYILNETDALGQRLDVRYGPGELAGEVTLTTSYADQTVTVKPEPFSVRVESVKQVVYIDFLAAYKESLRHFGLRAVDSFIRERVFTVLRRDFATTNVEFRATPPSDFALFAQVDIGGPDPNGLGLLGYDNTHGKDTENARLYDRIGGVNALTQEDGYPGYGGVFIESLFAYSSDPGSWASVSIPGEAFDQIIDPFRPDRGGQPILSKDLDAGVTALTSAAGCPAPQGNRQAEIDCAVFVLGNLIGTTVSHEIGHSLGLADPYGPSFHNAGDEPNRLMDSDRPFAERAELAGAGPSAFCGAEYEYLRAILPTAEPDDPTLRPTCG